VGEEEGGVKPIPRIGGIPEGATQDERLAWEKQKHEQRLQWAFIIVLGVGALGLMVPLVLWLSRVALGN
jgi:hypothetical protein